MKTKKWLRKKVFIPMKYDTIKGHPYKMEIEVNAREFLCIHPSLSTKNINKRIPPAYTKRAKSFSISHLQTGYELFGFISFSSEAQAMKIVEFLEDTLGEVLSFKNPTHCSKAKKFVIVCALAEAVVEKKLGTADEKSEKVLERIYATRDERLEGL